MRAEDGGGDGMGGDRWGHAAGGAAAMPVYNTVVDAAR
jgi:hypothetical protein